MKFSTFHLFSQSAGEGEQRVYDREIQVIKWADELGYDTAWIAEHHFRAYGIAANTMVLLAYLAGVTRQIKLASGIVIEPFHHPLRAAEDAAIVDLLSRGRLVYGFGRGYQGYEFAGMGADLEDTRPRTDEAMEIIRKAWTGEPFVHDGVYYQFPEVRVIPRPVQQMPRVVAACVSEESVAHYGSLGYPVMQDSTVASSTLRRLLDTWRAAATANGHAAEGSHVVMRLVNLTATNEEAHEIAMRGLPARGHSDESAKVYDPFLAFKEAPSAQERFALESAPIDPRTGRVAKGYEYWEKGYLGRGAAEFDPATELSWEERWVAGDEDRVRAKIAELEEMGVQEMICTFVGFGRREGEGGMEALHRTMAEFAERIIEPQRRQDASR